MQYILSLCKQGAPFLLMQATPGKSRAEALSLLIPVLAVPSVNGWQARPERKAALPEAGLCQGLAQRGAT